MQEVLIFKRNIREIANQPARLNNTVCFGLDISLIAVAMAASMIFRNPWIYTVSVFLIGSRMRGLMNLLHESSHNGLVIGNKFLNDLLGQVCAISLFMTRKGYTQSHMRHHNHFGDEAKDPDLIRYRTVFGEIAMRGANSLDQWAGAVLSVRKILAYAYLNPIRDLFDSERRNLITVIAFWVGVAALFTYLGYLDILFQYWLVPYFTGFKLICYVAEMAEHFGIYSKLSDLHRTRNMYVSKVAEFLIWPHGDNYHLVHHLFPFVPGFHLAQADSYLKRHCSSYAALSSAPSTDMLIEKRAA